MASFCAGLASATATFGDQPLTRTTGKREHVQKAFEIQFRKLIDGLGLHYRHH
jgi:hypothetical protein